MDTSNQESLAAGRSWLSRLNPTFVRETGWLAAGFASKFVIQMGTLYYLTHALGVEGVGIFFATIGLLACLVPFVQLGNYDLTIRQIARREDPAAVAGRAMRSSFASFVFFLPVLILLRFLLVKQVGWPAFLMVATGELLVMRVISNVQAVATGFRLHYVAAISDFVLGLSRFIAIYIAARLGANVNLMLMLYAFTALPTAGLAWGWMVQRIGQPKLRGGAIVHDISDHARMVVAWFAEMAAREGDKPLLNAFSNSREAGIYGTATRLFSIVLVPIDLLTQVFRPRIGQAYADGEDVGNRLARKMSLGLFGMGMVSGAGLVIAGAVLPHIAPSVLKGEFSEVRLALMYLAIIPPVYGLQRASVITAISRGATTAYATAMTISATLSTTFIIVFTPAHGWRAACLASMVYLAISAVAAWAFPKMGARTGEPVEDLVLEEARAADLQLAG